MKGGKAEDWMEADLGWLVQERKGQKEGSRVRGEAMEAEKGEEMERGGRYKLVPVSPCRTSTCSKLIQ